MGGRWGLPCAKRGRWATTTWTSVCAAVARLGRFLSSSTAPHAASQSLAITLVRKFDQLDVIKQQGTQGHQRPAGGPSLPHAGTAGVIGGDHLQVAAVTLVASLFAALVRF
jgi:hypothetical protein